MASGHVNRTKRPNTWLHRPTLQNVKKALANPEPSTHGTFRTCTTGRTVMSVLGEERKSSVRRQTDANEPGANIYPFPDKQFASLSFKIILQLSHDVVVAQILFESNGPDADGNG